MRRPSRRGGPTPRAAARGIRLPRPRCAIQYLRAVGPGVMAGLADNDPAGITAYSIAGAVAGNRQLWLLVLATFMVQAVQVTSARLGGLTGQGVLRLVRRRYGSVFAAAVALTAVAANQASLIADTAALGAALELLTGISWRWFILPAVLLLLSATVILNFREIRLLYLAVGTLALSYVAAAVLVRPDWGAVLRGTFLPSLPATLAEAAAAVALLGTTVSPYLLVWEAEGEREVARTRLDLRLAEIDVTLGFVLSDLISYVIVVTSAATLFTQHHAIQTAADAAIALRPLAGGLASTIFAVGLLGAGLLAVPMFAISSGFVVAETLGWPAGLSRPCREAPGFYAAVGLAYLSGAAALVPGVDPIQLMLASQILGGFLMPALVAVLALLANDPAVVGAARNPPYYNAWLAASFVVMTAAAGLLVYQLI